MLADYVDDLSNWYVRRSRRRFWAGDPAALQTLHECLRVLTLLHGALHAVHHRAGVAGPRSSPPIRRHRDSVHLAPWPVADEALIDAAAGRARSHSCAASSSSGAAARADRQVRTRQPLGRAWCPRTGWDRLDPSLRDELAAELNVLSMEALGWRRRPTASST